MTFDLILSLPNFLHLCMLETYALGWGVGIVLLQHEKLMAFFSITLLMTAYS